MRTSILMGFMIVAEAIRPNFKLPNEIVPVVIAIFVFGIIMDILEFFKKVEE